MNPNIYDAWNFQSRDVSNIPHDVATISGTDMNWKLTDRPVDQRASSKEPTVYVYTVSSESGLDPWDMIQFERDTGVR